MNTRYIIAIGYGLILAVIFASLFLNNDKLVRLENNVDQIQTNQMPSVEALGRMGIAASSIQRYLYKLTVEGENAGFEDARRQSLDLMTEVHSRQMIYNTRYVSDRYEQELFDRVQAAWNDFLPIAKSIASDPLRFRWNDSNQMGQLMASWERVDADVMKLIEYKAKVAGLAASTSVSLVEEVKWRFTVGSLTVVGLVLCVWVFTARFIKRSEDSIEKTICELRQSNAELIASQQTVLKLAYYDTLTGLPNQTQFAGQLAGLLAQDRVGVLFYIDLDNFKLVNDSHGHDWGDRFLVAFVKRLQSVLPLESSFCRLGGDEFTIVLPGATISQAIVFSGELLDSLRQPFLINNTWFFASASIGVVAFPDQGVEVAELLRKADVAMYKAKDAGKNGFSLFNQDMDEAIVERLSLETSLRTAIDKGELYLCYQPIVMADCGNPIGFEALLRWNSPEHGQVSPAKFIPVAEGAGLIVPIGEWVLKEACSFITQLHQSGYPGLKVSVNLSVKQLVKGNMATIAQQALRDSQLEPHLLELEITETLLMESTVANFGHIRELVQMGICIALDDFGTGYSSLTYLRKLPIGTLKLDKAFIDNITDEDDVATRAIVDGLIKIAQEMGLVIVAEGVETLEQLNYLRSHNCNYVQGYLISRPLTGKDCKVWLETRNQLL